MTRYIYALVLDQEVKYIGQTSDPFRRRREHRKSQRWGNGSVWKDRYRALPWKMVVLEILPNTDVFTAAKVERKWSHKYRSTFWPRSS